MKLINSRKSMELPLNTIIIAAILLVTLIVVLALFTNVFGKQSGQLKNFVSKTDDCDKDGTANMFDPCPCDYNIEECENRILVSCEEGKTPECAKP